jgi:hypothetical protein
MKWLSFMLAAALVSTVGCSGDSGKPAQGEGGKKLTVDAEESITLKQGETAKTTVSVKREKFEDEVKLTFDLPEGVTVEDKDPRIEKNGKEVTVTLKADAKAKVQDGYKATVTGEAAGLKDKAVDQFKVSVKEAK